MIELDKFPKGKKDFTEFCKDNMQKWVNEIAKQQQVEPRQITKEEAEVGVTGVFLSNPRILYDFFDKQEIYVTVAPKDYDNIGEGWNYELITSDHILNGGEQSKSRLEAELEAFKHSFSIYERGEYNKAPEEQ